ncbi:MAG: hypothetical protein B7733_11440 [Myxococcales bacterium FL481]|nr:MAG: hypothetical protein B7733_11440 [Myxococcales bacterium FL481]
MEQRPPELEQARQQLDIALVYAPDDPQLWTTLAELELAAGDPIAARRAVARALALGPTYAPARAIDDQLRDARLAGRQQRKATTRSEPRRPPKE